MADRWSDQDIARLHSLYPDLSKTPSQLEEVFGRKFCCIVAKAGKFGIRRPRPKAYEVDGHYLAVIDCPEKAYWLGFFAADGGLVKRVMVQFNLSGKDERLLRWMADQVAPDVAIKPRKDYPNMVYVQISDENLAKSLREWGMGQGKSHSLVWPNKLPFAYNIPFIVGYFDGDGSLGYSSRDGAWNWEIVGPERFLKSVRDILCDELGVVIPDPKPHSQSKQLYRLRTSGHQVIEIDDAFCKYGLGLARKRISSHKDNPDH